MPGEVGKSQKEVAGRGPLPEAALCTREEAFLEDGSSAAGFRVTRTWRTWTPRVESLRGEGQSKKRPRLFSPGRLGISSPPPELPNHEMDIKSPPVLCKRHLGNLVSAELSLG